MMLYDGIHFIVTIKRKTSCRWSHNPHPRSRIYLFFCRFSFSMGFFNMPNQFITVYGRIVKLGPESVKNNEFSRPVCCGPGRYNIATGRSIRSVCKLAVLNDRKRRRSTPFSGSRRVGVACRPKDDKPLRRVHRQWWGRGDGGGGRWDTLRLLLLPADVRTDQYIHRNCCDKRPLGLVTKHFTVNIQNIFISTRRSRPQPRYCSARFTTLWV